MVINDAASLDLVLVHPGGRSRVYQELGDRLAKVNLIGTMASFVDEAEATLTDSERPLQDIARAARELANEARHRRPDRQ